MTPLERYFQDLWGRLKQSAEKAQKRWIQKWEWMEAGSGGEMWRDRRAWGKGRNEQVREMKKEQKAGRKEKISLDYLP